MAVFSTITLNFGLEGWFSDRVRNVVANSLAAAQAYEEEHRVDAADATRATLADFLDAQKERNPLLSAGELRDLLTRGQLQMQRALTKAYVIDGDGELRARGERSYLFWLRRRRAPRTSPRARSGETVIIQDWENNEFRALLQLRRSPTTSSTSAARWTARSCPCSTRRRRRCGLYQQLEADRGRLLFEFALLYLGFAVILILAAIWLGLWFAERLSRPVGRLARRRGAGRARATSTCGCVEEEGDDEIALLGPHLQRDDAGRLKGQRERAASQTNAETERRRRLFDSVLSGGHRRAWSASTPTGAIEFVNRSAAAPPRRSTTMRRRGRRSPRRCRSSPPCFDRLDGARAATWRRTRCALLRNGRERDLLVRMSPRAQPTTARSRATWSPSTT